MPHIIKCDTCTSLPEKILLRNPNPPAALKIEIKVPRVDI
jgi:hypothetical protein